VTWIRVEADAGDDQKWKLLGKECGIPADEAFGKVVRLWGRVIEQREDGDLSTVPDEAVEEWAHWTGKEGRFAKAFRKLFTSDGRIKGWADHQGKLIARRHADRVRKSSGTRPELVDGAA
jgi:hypothetical protein